MASYTEEQKINYVILLHYRYNGQCETMGKAMDISRHSLKAWKQDYLTQAMAVMKNFDVGTCSGEDVIPDYDTLINKALARLNETLRTEIDPAKVANALVKLMELKKENGEKEKGNKFYDEINELLNINNQNTRTDDTTTEG